MIHNNIQTNCHLSESTITIVPSNTWRLLIFFIVMALTSITANAQTAVYTFKYDKLFIDNGKESLTGSGQVIVYDNQTVVFKGRTSNSSINRNFSFVKVSNVLEGSMLSLYSGSGDHETASKKPYIIIANDGDFAFFYEGDIDAGADCYSMSISDNTKGQNKTVMDRMLNDFENRYSVFSGFRSESDTELPLKIEGYSTQHTVNISPSGEEKAYSVRTKSGKLVSETGIGDFEVESDAAWANIKFKTDAAFLLNTEPNTIGVTRSATITVTAKGKSTTMIVNQPSTTVTIDKIWVEHNKWSGLAKGMKIHAMFHTYNVRGLTGQCATYFFFANGQKLMDYNMQFRAMDGQVCCGQNFIPNYDQTVFNDFEMFIPYTELHINGHADCKLNVQVSIGGQNAVSEDITFTFN